MMDRTRKMPVMYRYLLSFILILSVPLILFGYLLQGRFLSILSDEIRQNNLNTLNKTSSYIDWVYEQFDAIQQQIRLNRNLRPFFLFGNATSALDCVHELSVIKNSNDAIFDIALYYKQDGRVYTGAGSFSPESFLSTQLQFGDVDNRAFIRLLDEAGEPQVLPARDALLGAGNRERVVSFIYPIHYNDAKTPDATLVFFALEKDFFLAGDGEAADKKARTLVLDGERRPVLSHGFSSPGDTAPYLAVLSPEPQAGTFELDVDGTRYLCAAVRSTRADWTFMSFTPVSYALMKTQALSREMLLYFAIILTLAVAVIYWSMRLNYSPIKGLRDFAASAAEIDGAGNELDIVKSAVRSLQDRNQRLIQSTSAASCEYILRNLLKGRYSREEFHRLAASFQLSFPHVCYTVLSVHIQEPAGGKVAQAIQELLSQCFVSYLVEGAATSTAAIIVNCDGGEGEPLLDSLGELQREIAVRFDCELPIGVGNLYGDIKDIPLSYMESLYALDYRLIKGNNSIIPVSEIEIEDQVIQNYPYHDLEKLKYLLRLGDVDAIELLLGSMLDYIKNSGIPLFIARRLCFDIIGIITKSIVDMDIPLRSEKSWIALISRFETIDELIAAVHNISLNICTFIKENQSENVPLIDKLRAYARENCFRTSFSIQEMADHFDMGVTHLSQYFKNKSGQTILDFTSELRMARAQELLRAGTYKQSQIAEMVGYASHTSFIRRYKQYFGQTPGKLAQTTAAAGKKD